MEVVVIKKKHIAILTLFIISIFSFSIINQTVVRAVTIEGYSFSSNLVTDVELAWKLSKYEVSPEEAGDEYPFLIKVGKEMVEGDIFKIILLKDLNDASLGSFFDIYSSEVQWGEYFLNDVSLGKNASDIYWFGPDTTVGSLMTAPILPVTIELSTGTENYFDYTAEIFASLAKNETEGIQIKNSASTFSMKLEMHATIFLFGEFKIDYELEVVYNKEWGVLAKYDLYEKITSGGESEKVEIIYESESSEIQVPYSWTFSFIALFVTGIVVLVRRRKK
ncbi:MAG: hypothetical protein H7645_12150 [Candidatus Heimdallarchaeota archaeon]|nr:hypothetical protein [Candidatus Heimdallarchaeota archaeon]MCK4771076.1 hypothetical protein [Candidatus Heimdallarchaeota archaeon]